MWPAATAWTRPWHNCSASNLLSRFEHERPALPALALGSDGANLTAIAESSGLNEIFSRQLRALGQAGDVLLCISSSDGANNLLRAVQAAHERNMAVVVLSNVADSELARSSRRGCRHQYRRRRASRVLSNCTPWQSTACAN